MGSVQGHYVQQVEAGCPDPPSRTPRPVYGPWEEGLSRLFNPGDNAPGGWSLNWPLEPRPPGKLLLLMGIQVLPCPAEKGGR